MFVHTCSPHQSIQPAAVQTAIVHDWMALRTLDLLDSFSISPPHQKLSEILMLSSWQNHPSCSRLCSASHDSHRHGRSLLLIWRFSCRIHVWGWSRVKTRMDGWMEGWTYSLKLIEVLILRDECESLNFNKVSSTVTRTHHYFSKSLLWMSSIQLLAEQHFLAGRMNKAVLLLMS